MSHNAKCYKKKLKKKHISDVPSILSAFERIENVKKKKWSAVSRKVAVVESNVSNESVLSCSKVQGQPINVLSGDPSDSVKQLASRALYLA